MANPLKWPSFEHLGRDFYDQLRPCLQQLGERGATSLDVIAQSGLEKIEAWLNAPCVVTVKLDGTNLGIDNTGLVVGRNMVVPVGQSYQKCDVFALLKGHSLSAECLRQDFMHAAKGDCVVAQVMLYGELVVNNKYDYVGVGVFKSWLCFGAAVSPSVLSGEDADDAAVKLAGSLRSAGFNSRASGHVVVVSLNAMLLERLHELKVPTVAEGYMPSRAMTIDQWAEHDGSGKLPTFVSMRQLLQSSWAQRFLLPADGQPLGEGLVVVSELDGRQFKWKHGGEDLGLVPEQLANAVNVLGEISKSSQAGLLPSELLVVFERLLLVATNKPAVMKTTLKERKSKVENVEDPQALSSWESALTKLDTPEDVFARGGDARSAFEKMLIELIVSDLVKDYEVKPDDATRRAAKFVLKELGTRFAVWKRSVP